MKTKTKNYYIALRFKDRDDLHMTLRYFPNMTGGDKVNLMAIVGGVLKEPLSDGCFKTFRARFEIEAWFGGNHTVRVLEPKNDHEWPSWLLVLIAKLPKGSDKYSTFTPHVTCKDDVLDVEVESVALMTRKMEVCRWGLTQ